MASWDDFDALPQVNAVTIGGVSAADFNKEVEENGAGNAAAAETFEDLTVEFDAHGNIKKRKVPVPTSSIFDDRYKQLSEDKVPIPLRVLIAAQSQYQRVVVETDTGYTYDGILESVDASMNVKIKDAEIKKEVWALADQHHGGAPSTSGNRASSTAASATQKILDRHNVTGDIHSKKYIRKQIYHKPPPPFASSVMIRGSSIVFVVLPPSLEAEQRYMAAIIKKEVADKRRKDKKERLERKIEIGKKRERESAVVIANAANADLSKQQQGGGGGGGVVDEAVMARDKRRLAKAQEEARAAGQKLRRMLKEEARGERMKQKRKEGKGGRQGQGGGGKKVNS